MKCYIFHIDTFQHFESVWQLTFWNVIVFRTSNRTQWVIRFNVLLPAICSSLWNNEVDERKNEMCESWGQQQNYSLLCCSAAVAISIVVVYFHTFQFCSRKMFVLELSRICASFLRYQFLRCQLKCVMVLSLKEWDVPGKMLF